MDVDEGNEKKITIADLMDYIAPNIECCKGDSLDQIVSNLSGLD